MNKHWIILAALVTFSGCVSAARFKGQEAKLTSLQKELGTTKADCSASTQAAKKNADDLTTRNNACAEQLVSVQKSNKDLQESLEANKGELSRKVSDLIKEKDDLSQKLADSANENANIRKTKDEELAKTMTEKKALEEAKETEIAQVKKNYEDLTAGLKAEISEGAVTITQLKGKLTVNMVDKILFESGMAEVHPAGKKILENVGKVLSGIADKDIRIEGHTDNIPIGGDLKYKYPTNWELSVARATAVARYLQDNAKIDPKRMIVAGFGEYRPVSPNDTPEHRTLNRRIEIVLVAKE